MANLVLKDLSFEMANNEILGIMGPSGCGKSTLAKVVGGLLMQTGGTMEFMGSSLHSPAPRRGIQMVFQNPQASFNPRRRLGASLRRVAKLYGHSDDDEIMGLLKDLCMQEEVLERLPSQLSGGQLQRLSVLRSLLARPSLLILDEPTSALDISTQASIIKSLEALRSTYDVAYLFISHDKALMERFSDRYLYMRNGMLHDDDAIGTC
ncbi:MAG TPA: ATP-binding cassette domain-containing protein [Candidatus Methanofastidiosa archaeon]|nr:ATP-binding cassette domain-containing protein [Candidatus Methanofastidiosa archaeon]